VHCIVGREPLAITRKPLQQSVLDKELPRWKKRNILVGFAVGANYTSSDAGQATAPIPSVLIVEIGKALLSLFIVAWRSI
jgi:hypothetical protein